MPNEKLPQNDEREAEELLSRPQPQQEQEEERRLLPSRWSRRAQKTMPVRRRAAGLPKKPARIMPI